MERRGGESFRWRWALMFGALAVSSCVTAGAEANDSGQEYGCTDAAIAPYVTAEASQVLADIPDASTPEEAVSQIGDLYGVEVNFLTEDDSLGGVDFSPLEPSDYQQAADGLAEALSYLPVELVRRLNLSALNFVEAIEREGGSKPRGIYFGARNEIAITLGHEDSWHQVVVHELMHAIDSRILCSPEEKARQVEAWTDLSAGLYGKNETADNQVMARHIVPNSDRLFANNYSATSVGEDRATMLEYLFFERGLIQPGDPDWQSNFHKKQLLLLDQLEAIMPGIGDELTDRTPLLREKSDELTRSLPHPFNEGEFASPRAIAAYAYVNGAEIEQLVGAQVRINKLEGPDLLVESPVVVRDKFGQIVGLAWTKYGEKDGLMIEHAYFDQATMSFVGRGELWASSRYGQVDTTGSDGKGFLFDSLSIGGVIATSQPIDDL